MLTTTITQQKQEFIQILKLTLVPDNQQRQLSEDMLNSVDSLIKARLLLDVLINEKDITVVQAAALMLRRLIIQIKIVTSEQIPGLNDIKFTIPSLCLKETNSAVRNKLVDILTELIRLANSKSGFIFNEAVHFLYECVQSKDEIAKLIAFRILQSSLPLSSHYNDEHISEIYKNIIEIMSLEPIKQKHLIIEAAKAFVNFSIYLPKSRVKNVICSPFQQFLNIIKSTSDEKLCLELLEELDNIINYSSQIIIPFITTIVELVVRILSSPHSNESLRIGAMECLVLVAENRRKEFQENCYNYLDTIVDMLLRHMTILEEDPRWAYTLIDDEECDDINTLASEAESSLDRIAVVVSSITFLNIVNNKVSALLASNIWQHRYAALSAISCITEGTRTTMKQFLPGYVDTICPFLKDEHPRVAYACISCIGELFTYFHEYLSMNFHEKIYTLMFSVSEYYVAFPRVQSHAVYCFIDLIESCPTHLIELYDDKFFHYSRSAFIRSVNEIKSIGVAMVLENSLIAISKLAKTVTSSFKKYYSIMVPELIALLLSLSSTRNTKYYILALDTLANIAMAVQKEVCKQDIGSIIEIMKRFDISAIQNDENHDYQFEYLEIVVCMAKVFGEDISLVIPHLVPTLFTLTSMPIENPLLTSPRTINDQISSDPSLQNVINARNDALQDRWKALCVVNKLFKLMKASMLAYIERMLDIVLKNFNEVFDDRVQYSCIKLFSSLLKSAGAYNTDYMLSVWIKIFYGFYQRVIVKNSLFKHDRPFDGLEICLSIVSVQGGLNEEIRSKLIEMVNYEIITIVEDYASHVPKDTSDDELIIKTEENDDLWSDDDPTEDDDDPCDQPLSSLNDFLRYLIQLLGPEILYLWSEINSNICIMSNSINPTIKCNSLLMYSHVFKYMPNESVTLSVNILKNIIKALEDENTDVKKSAIHCVSTISEYAPGYYKNFLENALFVIVTLIGSSPQPLSESRDAAIESAIVSVGKILKFCPEIISSFDTAVQKWISWLPIDQVNVDFVVEYLLELTESQFEIVLGGGDCNLPKVLDSIVYMMSYTTTPLNNKSLNVLRVIQNRVPVVFRSWFEDLSVNDKQTILAACSLCDEKID